MNIIELRPFEIRGLLSRLAYADDNESRVRIAFEGGLKVKVGENMWSASMGVEDPDSDVARARRLLTGDGGES